jgi:hypothetical protein
LLRSARNDGCVAVLMSQALTVRYDEAAEGVASGRLRDSREWIVRRNPALASAVASVTEVKATH